MSHIEPLHLVLAADERFAMPLAVTIDSALQQLGQGARVQIWILDGGIRDVFKLRIETVARSTAKQRCQNIEMHWVVPDVSLLPNLENYQFHNSNLNQIVFYRFTIPSVLPQDVQRALFLDCDLVVRADLFYLWQMIPSTAPLIAVRDYSIPTLGDRYKDLPRECREVGPTAPYFNAGILGINVDYWRRQDVPQAAIRLVEESPSLLRYNDQDALNIVLAGRWHEMDLSWNVQTGGPDRIRRLGGTEQEFLGEPYEQIRQRAKIIHFTGNKPWEQGFTNPDRPAFFEALRESGWFGPIGFRRWQAGWWAKLLKRQANKRLERYRQGFAKRGSSVTGTTTSV